MAKFKKDNIEKVTEGIGDAIGFIPNIINSIATLFGVNLKKTIFKDWMHLDWDYTTMVNAINTIYSKAEITDNQMLDRINKGLENLIGLSKSPAIKRALNNITNRLEADKNKIIKNQAEREVNKVRANALASDIDAANFGDVMGSQWNNNMRELQRNLTDEAVKSGNKEAISRAKEFNDKTMHYSNSDEYGAAQVENKV